GGSISVTIEGIPIDNSDMFLAKYDSEHSSSSSAPLQQRRAVRGGRAPAGISQLFSAWWLELGIRIERIDSCTPRQNRAVACLSVVLPARPDQIVQFGGCWGGGAGRRYFWLRWPAATRALASRRPRSRRRRRAPRSCSRLP